MKWRADPLNRLLTARGVSFGVLSLVAFAVGAARAELAALLWGSAFLFLFVLALLLTLVWTAGLRRRIDRMSDPPALVLERVVVEPDEPVTIRLERIDSLTARVPGVSVVARMDLAWRGGRSAWAEYEIDAFSSRAAVRLQLSGRGVYGIGLTVIVRDSLGFTRTQTPVYREEPLTLTVLPAAVRHTPPLPPIGGTGEGSPDSRERARSDELYEVRRYAPGDDPRRIHWKAFARFNTLLVRVGEDIPRPRGHLLLLLHSPFGVSLDLLDRAVSVCADLARTLARQNVICDVVLPAPPKAQSRQISAGEVGGDDQNINLRTLLSDVAPGDVLPRLPGAIPGQVLLVTAVGARSAADNPVPELARRGVRVGLYLVGSASVTVASKSGRDLQHLLDSDMLSYRELLSNDSYVELV